MRKKKDEDAGPISKGPTFEERWAEVKEFWDFDKWGLDKERKRKSTTRARELNDSAWSSGLVHCQDNKEMIICCLLGGTCVQHGHNQDLMDTTGCLIPCLQACVVGCCCFELTRTRRDMRVRLGIKGVWFLDCIFACLVPYLTVCQETRELELRTKSKWHPLWGFRERTKFHTSFVRGGKHPFMLDICCGEDTFQDTVPFVLEQRPGTAWQEDGAGQQEGGGGEGEEEELVVEEVDGEGKAALMGAPFVENQMSR